MSNIQEDERETVEADVVQPQTSGIAIAGATVVGAKRKVAQAFQETTDNAQKLTAQAMEAKRAQLNRFVKVMDHVGNGCGYCLVHKDLDDHSPLDCPRIKDEGGVDILRQIRRGIVYTKFMKTCFKCHINSFGYDVLHSSYKDGSTEPCPAPNLMLGIFYAVWTNATYRADIENKDRRGKKFKDLAEFIGWLTHNHHFDRTNAMHLLAWLGNTVVIL